MIYFANEMRGPLHSWRYTCHYVTSNTKVSIFFVKFMSNSLTVKWKFKVASLRTFLLWSKQGYKCLYPARTHVWTVVEEVLEWFCNQCWTKPCQGWWPKYIFLECESSSKHVDYQWLIKESFITVDIFSSHSVKSFWQPFSVFTFHSLNILA